MRPRIETLTLAETFGTLFVCSRRNDFEAEEQGERGAEVGERTERQRIEVKCGEVTRGL